MSYGLKLLDLLAPIPTFYKLSVQLLYSGFPYTHQDFSSINSNLPLHYSYFFVFIWWWNIELSGMIAWKMKVPSTRDTLNIKLIMCCCGSDIYIYLQSLFLCNRLPYIYELKGISCAPWKVYWEIKRIPLTQHRRPISLSLIPPNNIWYFWHYHICFKKEKGRKRSVHTPPNQMSTAQSIFLYLNIYWTH